jgi:hypothetical protein
MRLGDFSLLLPDVMVIADEQDAKLTLSTGSFMKLMSKSTVVWDRRVRQHSTRARAHWSLYP